MKRSAELSAEFSSFKENSGIWSEYTYFVCGSISHPGWGKFYSGGRFQGVNELILYFLAL